MKYFLTGLLIQLFTFSSFAITFSSRINSIEKGSGNIPDLLLMENGRTVFLDPTLKEISYSLEEIRRKRTTIEVTLDKDLSLVSMSLLPVRSEDDGPNPLEKEKPLSYEPSVVSYERAKKAFKKMRKDYQNESQCYNRAHIWSYEEYKRSRMKTAKLFLFFTTRYIRNYRYKWWFHVTPMALVNGREVTNWRTMDRRYTGGLRKVQSWTNEFMLNDAVCPIVSRYSDYSENQYAEDCYLIPTSMYYWQPRDIDKYERSGYYKKQFFSKEIKHSYWEAF